MTHTLKVQHSAHKMYPIMMNRSNITARVTKISGPPQNNGKKLRFDAGLPIKTAQTRLGFSLTQQRDYKRCLNEETNETIHTNMQTPKYPNVAFRRDNSRERTDRLNGDIPHLLPKTFPQSCHAFHQLTPTGALNRLVVKPPHRRATTPFSSEHTTAKEI
jgi:hypothetical protein